MPERIRGVNFIESPGFDSAIRQVQVGSDFLHSKLRPVMTHAIISTIFPADPNNLVLPLSRAVNRGFSFAGILLEISLSVKNKGCGYLGGN